MTEEAITNEDLDREVEAALAFTERAFFGFPVISGHMRPAFISVLRARLNAGEYHLTRKDGAPHVGDSLRGQ